ncbi:hypothetical protein OS189_12455 [Sulfitobacter sp. F26169L]|uniref:hypothetical protein n=1 Tax=Sulfitobacter sp. F26169L TaxID=2996015 RepID=UPI002260F7B0|nr:hypothetical protein [Sulfitobacter sp. F26169L]MCX7567156.1 hypothetical protein [Sulfitobacter sp. F26169L]
MTIQTHITAAGGHEAPPETELMLAFCESISCMQKFLLAELDLDDVGYSQDLAYSNWVRDSEVAFSNLADALGETRNLPVEIPEDTPLKRMALLMDEILGNEDPAAARAMHLKMQLMFFTQLQATGLSPTAIHRNGLLVHARHLVDAMMSFPSWDRDLTDDLLDDHGPTDEMIFGF